MLKHRESVSGPVMDLIPKKIFVSSLFRPDETKMISVPIPVPGRKTKIRDDFAGKENVFAT